MYRQNRWNKLAAYAVTTMLICTAFMTTPTDIYAETTSSTSSNTSSSSSTSTTTTTSSHTDYSGAYSSSNYIKPGNYWFTPSAKYGELVTITLPIVNMTPYNLKEVVITPIISGNKKDWPFEITQTNYVLKLDSLVGSKAEPDVNKRTKDLFWTFQVRDDVMNGYYPIQYQILYTDELCNQGSCTISTYIECTGKPGAKSVNGDDADEKKSTPRIIVTGFETDPAEVFAGENFMLTIHVKNTSSKTPVQNVEFDLEAAVEGKDNNAVYSAFLPTSGSNSVYVDSIPTGGTIDMAVEFTAKADLSQKPYVLNIKMKYEDSENNPYEATGSVSIPVRQESKFDISSFEVTPTDLTVGHEANIMFSVYNTGKTKLYNVKAKILADSITGGDAFVGNLDSGATGNVDVMVTGVQPTMDDGTIKAVVSYEDDAGKVFEQEFTTELFVNEEVAESDMGMDVMPMEEEPSGLPIWLIGIIIGVVVAAAVVVNVILVKKKKKKKQAQLLIEDLSDDED